MRRTPRAAASHAPTCYIKNQVSDPIKQGMVAELLLGHQTPCMLPRGASLAFWATQVGYVVHPG